MNRKFEEETVQSRRIYTGRTFKLLKDKVRLPNGVITAREVVDHPGAVAIVPLIDNKSVILVRQYRYAVKDTLWEIPAGTIEPGEQPLACAKRELAEETGYRAGSFELLFECYLAPGYSSEKITMYLAKKLSAENAKNDEDEIIYAQSFEVSKALRMIIQNKIRDAKTISGLLFTTIRERIL